MLRLLHPFMPFVTEELWTKLPLADRPCASLLIAPWPIGDERRRSEEACGRLDQVITIIEALRTIRGENRISHSAELTVVITTPERAQTICATSPRWRR